MALNNDPLLLLFLMGRGVEWAPLDGSHPGPSHRCGQAVAGAGEVSEASSLKGGNWDLS